GRDGAGPGGRQEQAPHAGPRQPVGHPVHVEVHRRQADARQGYDQEGHQDDGLDEPGVWRVGPGIVAVRSRGVGHHHAPGQHPPADRQGGNDPPPGARDGQLLLVRLAVGHPPEPAGHRDPDEDPGRGDEPGQQLCAHCAACSAASRASDIAPTGASCPVIRSTWRAAWCNNMRSPLITDTPACCHWAAHGVGHPAYTTSNTTAPSASCQPSTAGVAPPGTVLTTTPGVPHAAGPSAYVRTVGVMPRRVASCSAPGRAVARTRKRTCSTPNRLRATSAERAVAPDPTTTAEDTLSRPASRRACSRPATSVLSARQPTSRRVSVLAAPTRPASSPCSTASASASSLSGMVTDSPSHSADRFST